MLDKIINTNKWWSVPEMFEVEGVGIISIRRPYAVGKPCRRDRHGMTFYNPFSTDRKKFFKQWKKKDAKGFGRYQKAGRWLTPEEGKRVYGEQED